MRNGFPAARDCNAPSALRRVNEFSKLYSGLLNAYRIHKIAFPNVVPIECTNAAMFLQPIVKAMLSKPVSGRSIVLILAG